MASGAACIVRHVRLDCDWHSSSLMSYTSALVRCRLCLESSCRCSVVALALTAGGYRVIGARQCDAVSRPEYARCIWIGGVEDGEPIVAPDHPSPLHRSDRARSCRDSRDVIAGSLRSTGRSSRYQRAGQAGRVEDRLRPPSRPPRRQPRPRSRPRPSFSQRRRLPPPRLPRRKAPAAAKPARGGTLTVSQSVDINTLHPWIGTLNVWKVIKTDIYDQLVVPGPADLRVQAEAGPVSGVDDTHRPAGHAPAA